MPKKPGVLFDYGIYSIIMPFLDLQNNHKFKKLYGDFGLKKNYERSRVYKLPSESGIIFGTIVEFTNSIKPVSSLLLPGENIEVGKVYSNKFSIPRVVTIGINAGMDYFWDFEKDPPDIGKFELIISQAMLEHLINPFKHLVDLSRMLDDKGYLIIHSVMPGYFYHRYPIDCQRFYPDWFEEMAKRLNLRIVSKHLHRGHIFYMYCNDL